MTVFTVQCCKAGYFYSSLVSLSHTGFDKQGGKPAWGEKREVKQ